MPRLIDLNGQVFGHLTVLSRVPATGGQARWLCRCECGNETVAPGYDLRRGMIKSCGCRRLDGIKNSNFKHGRTKTKEYMVWANMRNRCYRPNVRGYDRYGAVGITVCERWRNSFENFFADMGECPDGHTFDRIDPSGNYEPANCRWTSYEVQNLNKKRTIYATLNGVKKPIRVWCKELGFKYSTVRARVSDLGWTPERALTTPIR